MKRREKAVIAIGEMVLSKKDLTLIIMKIAQLEKEQKK